MSQKEMSTANMNLKKSKKYGFSPEEVEQEALQSERFRTDLDVLAERIKKKSAPSKCYK